MSVKKILCSCKSNVCQLVKDKLPKLKKIKKKACITFTGANTSVNLYGLLSYPDQFFKSMYSFHD